MPLPPAAELIHDETPLELEFGGCVPALDIAYESWGTLAPDRDNVVLVCPAFSAHCHANSSPRDPSAGWWEGMIGPGKAFDTDRFFVLCPSLLGGSYGTTGPQSLRAETGRPWNSDFPVITVRDIVAVHIRLLDHLGIDKLHAVAGGSLGAMEVLELAFRYPRRTRYAIAASGTDRTRPYTAAIRHLGRRAIMLDTAYQGGRYTDEGPTAGLMLAREIGTLFYRSRSEFNERFPSEPIRPPSREGITFDVQSYLDHQGKKILGRFDANSYLTMSLAMDLHNIWRGFTSDDDAMSALTASFMIIGCHEDSLIPLDEQETFHQRLVAAGKHSSWRAISSPIGHDAFLVELDQMTALVHEHLGEGMD